MARPSKYTPELLEVICARLSKGEPLAAICRDEGMPDPATVWRWGEADETVSQAIARAREAGEDWLAAECLLIADTPEIGVETTTKPNGDMETREGDMLGHRKLRIDTRLKLLAKWNPRKWGDKVAHEHGGSGGHPIKFTIVTGVPEPEPAADD